MPTYRIEAAPFCPRCYDRDKAGAYMRQVSELDTRGNVVWQSAVKCFKCGYIERGERGQQSVIEITGTILSDR